jgi:hypothetical protein
MEEIKHVYRSLIWSAPMFISRNTIPLVQICKEAEPDGDADMQSKS